MALGVAMLRNGCIDNIADALLKLRIAAIKVYDSREAAQGIDICQRALDAHNRRLATHTQ